VRIGVHRENDHAGAGVLVEQPGQDIQATFTTEVDVQKHHFGSLGTICAQRLVHRCRLADIADGGHFEQPANTEPDDDVIIDKQDPHWWTPEFPARKPPPAPRLMA
jgi:hypothetical protein